MKKILGGALLCVLAAACGGPSDSGAPPPNTGFSETYSGSVNENYTCTNSAPPTFIIPNDQLHMDIDAAGNANIYFASCPNDIFTGYESADGTTITIHTTNAYSCTQTTGSDSIDITQISGTIQFANGGVELYLNELALIDGDTCSGTANGQLN